MATKNPYDSDDEFQWRAIGAHMSDNRRVLVVDDYADAADALQLLLFANGFECRAMHRAEDVCELASQWQPFAVVLDIAMPGVDGLELARRLRASDSTSHMLLIACTGYASQLDRERAREAGFDAHCAKPLTPQRLLELLKQATSGDV
ncbi:MULTISPECIES: response regulator [Paraburkholderia]|jgi:CheY-like chemotaxis protein|uniref:Two-component system response regulator n=1 Tax=Paraburkholderia largidicola TaxID=3014751 RepID=A0A7I8BQG5_9BURK|nr:MULTISPECIES: response regulator [Paraburkholderia]BEU24543.1 response regulator [Paraburkholderia sp. 22B1P]GJH38463.1 response regulator [Paraburkholderia hospita]CAG9260423.1 Response regulator [Paraburkholderia caribensis]BCF90753.1 two-component system response regulator [Paraburkholderia sp. PGU16]GJH01611.1 response regulator [Paraburkholderia terrae]